MQIQIGIPDDLAVSLETRWGNLEHYLREFIVLQAYREGSISIGKVRELLNFKTRLEVDLFLKEKGIDLAYNETDLESDRQVHIQLRQEEKIK